MLRFVGRGSRLCDGWTRREVLRVGGLGMAGAGLTLADLGRHARASEAAGQGTGQGGSFGRAKACIVLFLMGGPPQHSTWDPKPDAPADVRGAFGPIPTNVPGLSFCELFPRVAKVADTLCVLRAMSTGDNAHSSSGYYMLTGVPHVPMNFENANPGPPNDHPCLGALLGRLSAPRGALPPAVRIPQRIFNTDGSVWPGQDAGFLGRGRDPWLLNAVLTPEGYRIQEIELPAELDPDRVSRRRDLGERLGRSLDVLERDPTAALFDEHSRHAYDLLRSPEARRAFRLDLEPEAVRARYGDTPFGQGVLQARRLVEAGVRLVQVNWYRGPDEPSANPCWDSHSDETARLKDVLMPPTDQALSALIEDLRSRGMLEETLVVCMSEFGRSPRLDGAGGRGHWGYAFSVALAGGGVRGGQAFGSTDRIGAYPRDGKLRPEDLSATIFHLLGHSPSTEFLDPLDRPHPISRGEVARGVVG